MRLLTNSIRTIKFIKAIGVPCGSKWDSICLVFFIHPNVIIVTQIVKDNGRVIGRWAVVEKFCGYKATRFIGRMSMNIISKIVSIPFFLFPSA
jgi:hypothetical protein